MDKLNSWLTLFANCGVLVGIVFLAIEVNQNTEALERERSVNIASSFVQRNEAISDTMLAVALDPDFAVLVERWRETGTASLSDDEIARVRFYEWSLIFMLESQLAQYEQGLLNEEYYEYQFKGVIRRLGRGWEELGLVEIQKPSLRNKIRSVLSEMPVGS